MKTRRTTLAKKIRPSICSSTIATAIMVLTQVGSFAPSASADSTVALGDAVTIGVDPGPNFLKLGGGTTFLSAPSPGLTGTTTIRQGSLVVTDPLQLGTSAVVVETVAPIAAGQCDGNLTIGGGITIGNTITLRGQGLGDQSAALTSVGNNTLSGALSTGTGAATRVFSTYGTTTLSATNTVSLALGQTFTVSGNANWFQNAASVISGGSSAALTKAGGGSLELQGTNTYGGITTVNAGFLRVASAANIGSNTATNAIQLQGGTLEIRSNAPSFATKGVTNNTGTGTIFVDHAVGADVLNQTATFAALTQSDANRTTVLNGRNGYGVSFTSVGTTNQSVIANVAGNQVITNNLNGLATYNGDFWNLNNATSRTFTMNGTGDSVINGNIQATGTAAHNFTKAGAGIVTLVAAGTGSNITGQITVSAGTLGITSITALNNAATGTGSRINLDGGTLTLTGAGGAADYSIAKTINLSGAGAGSINANQSTAFPVVISSFESTGAGSKNLNLGGSSTQDNLISAAIVNNGGTGVTSLVKNGAGTWALSGANTYGGNTTVNGGTLKVLANGSDIIPNTSNLIFGVSGGTLQHVGQLDTTSVETLGQLVPTAGAGTLLLTGTGTGSSSLVFTATGTATTGLGAVNNASSVNIVGANATNTVTLTGVTTGLVDPHITYNGADFAYSASGVLRAPVYDGVTDGATFVTVAPAGTLTTLSHNNVTGGTTASTAGADTILSLRSNGSNTITLAGRLTINTQGLTTGATTTGGILQSGGTTTITGAGNISTGTAGNLAIRVDLPADVLNLDVPIQATGGGLTKNGAGTLVLSQANAQSGATTINEGTLRLSGIGILSAANQNLAIRKLGTFDLNGVSTGTRINALDGEGLITNTNAAAATLTVGNGNTAGSFAGLIQDGTGVVSLNKAGTATQTLNNPAGNTYTGTTTITSTGIIAATVLANGGVASSIGQSSNAASNLVFNGSGSATGANAGLSYTGAASISTDRLLTLDGSAANGGGRIQANGANGASLMFSNTGAIVVSGTGTKLLTFGGASTNDNMFAPQIVDGAGTATVGVWKADAGLWILDPSTANTYTRATTIQNGMLQAQDGVGLSSASNLVLGNGTAASTAIFQSSGTFARTLGTGAGQMQLVGIGTAAAVNVGFAASTAKLDVTLGGGTATWGSALFMPTANQALLLNSTTALAEVDFQGGIDLNGGAREIQVLENTNAGTDLATISGLISGTGTSGVIKTGAGILQLTNNTNSYTGDTQVRQGVLRATSLGSGGNSSVGAAGGAVVLGINATSGTLEYVGGGETSARLITVGGTSGAQAIIRSQGSGALVLSNVVNGIAAGGTGTTTKTLTLGGENSANNELTGATAVLADNNGPLLVNKVDGGVWTLSGANTYTGTTTVTSGLLGIGAASAGAANAVTSGPIGTGLLTFAGGSIFADGGARTILNTVAGSGTGQVAGENNLTFAGDLNAGVTINNLLKTGSTMFVTGNTMTTGTAAATTTLGGSGATVFTGAIANGTAAGAGATSLTYAGGTAGTLALNASSITATGNITVSGGMADINSTGAFGNLVVSGGTANLNIAAANTGVTTISGGVTNINVVGGINPVNLLNLNGGTIQAASDAAGVISNTVLLGGNPTFAGTSTIALTGASATLTAARTVTNNIASPKQLLVNAPVNLGLGTGASFVLTLSGTGDTQVNGLIANGGSTAGGVTVNTGTSGLVSLNNAGNSYTGNTTLTAGNLNVGVAGGISATGSSLVLTGGVLTASSVAAGSIGNLVILNGTTAVAGANTIQFAGNVVNNGGNRVLNNNITGIGQELLMSGGVSLQESTGTGGRTLTLGGTGNTRTTAPITTGGVSGISSLTKTGTGTFQYDAVNTFNGVTTINAGTIKAGVSGGLALGTAMTLNPNTIGGTATLDLNNNSLLTNGLTISGSSGSISTVQTGTGTLGVTAVTYTTTAINNPAQATISGNLSLGTGGTRTFTVGDSTDPSALTTDLLISAAISKTGTAGTASVTKAGLGAMKLSNVANTYNGVTTVNAGSLQVVKLADGGLPSSIGQSAATNTQLVISGTNGPATLEYMGSGDSTNRLFTIGAGTGGAVISNTGAGALNFTGTGALAIGAGTIGRTLTLAGTNTGTNVLTPIIPASGTNGAVTLIKNGSNTWSLAAAAGNNYAGNTIINGGTLLANNTTGSATGTVGTVTVNAGGTLGGSGSVGAIVMAGGNIAPGNSVGTLSAASIDLTTGTFKLEIDGAGLAADKLAVSGALTLSLGLGSVLDGLELSAGSLTVGSHLNIATYGTINYGAGGRFAVGGFAIDDIDLNPLATFQIGTYTYGLDYNDALFNAGNSVSLVVQVPEPGTIGSLIGGFGVLLGMRRRRNDRRA